MLKTIYYTYTNYSSFVEKDFHILKKLGIVHKNKFPATSSSLKIIVFLLKQLFLIRKMFKGKIIFVSVFAGYHTVIPSVFSKIFPNVFHFIRLGGTDSNYLKSIDYGNFHKKVLGIATCFSAKYATGLIPVSRHLIKSKYHYGNESMEEQGITSFCKNIKTPFEEIFNGYDFEKFKLLNQEREKFSFVTISVGIQEEKRRMLKGVDLILELAPLLPQCSFTIIGSEFTEAAPENVFFIPFVANSDLSDLLNTKEYYFQLSLSEGFPNALCEGMLCGCIPIVSNIGIMPEIVDGNGGVLMDRDVNELMTLVTSLLETTFDKKVIRDSIIDRYNIQLREKKILAYINKSIK